MGKHGSPNVKKLIAKQRTKQAAKSQLATYMTRMMEATAQAIRNKQGRR